jgi:hypothetical protein
MNELKTKVVNVKHSDYDIYIGRPSKWGNPFRIGKLSRLQAVQYHLRWLYGQMEAPDGREPPPLYEIKKELTGKRLGCYCTPDLCHGDNYVKICEGMFPDPKF